MAGHSSPSNFQEKSCQNAAYINQQHRIHIPTGNHGVKDEIQATQYRIIYTQTWTGKTAEPRTKGKLRCADGTKGPITAPIGPSTTPPSTFNAPRVPVPGMFLDAFHAPQSVTSRHGPCRSLSLFFCSASWRYSSVHFNSKIRCNMFYGSLARSRVKSRLSQQGDWESSSSDTTHNRGGDLVLVPRFVTSRKRERVGSFGLVNTMYRLQVYWCLGLARFSCLFGSAPVITSDLAVVARSQGSRSSRGYLESLSCCLANSSFPLSLSLFQVSVQLPRHSVPVSRLPPVFFTLFFHIPSCGGGSRAIFPVLFSSITRPQSWDLLTRVKPRPAVTRC